MRGGRRLRVQPKKERGGKVKRRAVQAKSSQLVACKEAGVRG